MSQPCIQNKHYESCYTIRNLQLSLTLSERSIQSVFTKLKLIRFSDLMLRHYTDYSKLCLRWTQSGLAPTVRIREVSGLLRKSMKNSTQGPTPVARPIEVCVCLERVDGVLMTDLFIPCVN